MSGLGRREFVALLGGAAAAWPLVARAQQPPKMPRLVVLLYSTPQADPQMEAVRTGLRELGYIEGRNVAVSYRYAEGEPERLPGLAVDLVREKPDLLLAIGGDVAPHAVAATSTVPIVFATSSDPVQHGLVESLSRPGRNATGVTFIQDDLASKRLEFFKEAVPVISRVAFLWNPDHLDNELREAQRAAQNLGVKLQPIEMRGPRDLENAFRRYHEFRLRRSLRGDFTTDIAEHSKNCEICRGNTGPVGRWLWRLGASRGTSLLWTQCQ